MHLSFFNIAELHNYCGYYCLHHGAIKQNFLILMHKSNSPFIIKAASVVAWHLVNEHVILEGDLVG